MQWGPILVEKPNQNTEKVYGWKKLQEQCNYSHTYFFVITTFFCRNEVNVGQRRSLILQLFC